MPFYRANVPLASLRRTMTAIMYGRMITRACLIIIGNEILSGRTQDKNLAFIAVELNKIGIRLMEVRVIPDIEATIIATVNTCREQFDYVLTTGGIGPTHDDITSASIAKAFGVALHRHPQAVQALEAHYADKSMLNEARLKMADVPVGSTLIPNAVSGAPGFSMGNVIVMAGVPSIMQYMLKATLPRLHGSAPMFSFSITTTIGEGTLAEGLSAIQQRYQDVEIGSYPKFKQGELSTTLVFSSPDEARNTAAAEEAKTLIASLGGKILAD